MTATVLNAKISEAENKIPDASNLVNTAVLNKKVVKLRTKFLIMINILLLLILMN